MGQIRNNWFYWAGGLDVTRILELAETKTLDDATTFGGPNDDYRRSKVAWLSGNTELMDLLFPYAESAGTWMNIDVKAIADFQYTEYHATENGKYDWHHDVDWNNNNGRDRKLSMTVQLSDPEDYEGGIFEFGEGVEQPQANSREKGTVLVFPSYLQHCVTPVTKGVRKTLVAWFEGPTWR